MTCKREVRPAVATNDGLARFNPMGRREPSSGNDRMFITHRPENTQGGQVVNVLFEDHEGRLWCGTENGLYWFEEEHGKGVFPGVELPKVHANSSAAILTINEDTRGNLWIGSVTQGLFSLAPDGRIERFSNQKGLPVGVGLDPPHLSGFRRRALGEHEGRGRGNPPAAGARRAAVSQLPRTAGLLRWRSLGDS